MGNKPRSQPKYFLKRWAMIIGLFLLIQLIFMLTDGTSFVPNINDSNQLIARIGRWILNSRLFTEWIAPYSFAFFNLCLTVHVIAILIQLGHDVISKKYKEI